MASLQSEYSDNETTELTKETREVTSDKDNEETGTSSGDGVKTQTDHECQGQLLENDSPITIATSVEAKQDSCLSSSSRTQTDKSTDEERSLCQTLNDAGKFSYVALFSVDMGLLFEDGCNKGWRETTARSLVRRMNLPKRTGDTMVLLTGADQADSENIDIFAKSLLNDADLDRTRLIVQDLIGHALSDGQYDARARTLAMHIATIVEVQEQEFHDLEAAIVSSFTQKQEELSEEEVKENKKRAKMKKLKRFGMIGVAAVGGGALIGITGGLAAPLIASAGVALLGSGVGFLTTTASIAIMASLFGAAGAGLTGFKMKKRVGAIEEFEFETISNDKDLHVTICVSGWLTKTTLANEDSLYDNFSLPWLGLATSREVYSLRWESKFLLELGEALTMIVNKMLTMAAKEALKMTVLAGLLVAFALPATAYTALVAIDNPWSVVTNRAAEAGKQLAEVLLARHQGKRPVTLIGFSMGARVIFFCLREMSNRKGCEGIVQDVVLLGAPVPSTVKYWTPLARVVAGRIINGYCRGDWLLQYVYRTASVQKDIAGLGPIMWDNRRMVNVDLTEIVNGHLDYSDKMDEILKHMGLRMKERPAPMRPRASSESNTSVDDNKFTIIDASDLLVDQPTGTAAANIPQSSSEPALTSSDKFKIDKDSSSILHSMSEQDMSSFSRFVPESVRTGQTQSRDKNGGRCGEQAGIGLSQLQLECDVEECTPVQGASGAGQLRLTGQNQLDPDHASQSQTALLASPVETIVQEVTRSQECSIDGEIETGEEIFS